ncbi:MAG: hypothetical protein ACRDTC_04290 [Pseudonocardiaceae bacterium]
MAGHVQAVGNAFEHLKVSDLSGSGNEGADGGLGQVDGHADAELTHTEVLADEGEEATDVASAQYLGDVVTVPKIGRNAQRLER